MSVKYTRYCGRFGVWCVMATDWGECSKTACSYGFDRPQVHYYGKDADIYVVDEHIESEGEE